MIKSELGAYISDEMSFDDIADKIKEKPVLIIPIGGFEPLGDDIPIGLMNNVLQEITELVATENNCLSAPLMKYGFSTPFSAFSGAFSMKRNIFESVLRNIVFDSLRWGFKKILFINLSTIPSDFFPRLLKSLSKKVNVNNVLFFDFQNNKKVRQKAFGNQKNDMRMEHEILSLALKFKLIESDDINSNDNNDSKVYSKWRRRGRDPELFKKKYPKGTVNSNLDECSIEEGDSFLKLITDACSTLISCEGIQ